MDRLQQSVDECLARLEVHSGDEVAILADTDTEPKIWRALFASVVSLGGQPTVVLITPRSANGLEPTVCADDALSRASVVFAITGASATHTKALKRAAQNGARICSMPGINLDIMRAPVMTPDYEEMQALGDRLAEMFASAEWMRVTTTKGTDLRVAMGGWNRMPMVDDGHVAPGMIANLPAGEALIVPWEGGSEGVVVIDLAVSCYPKPLSEPVRITFRNGRVADVEGSSEPAQRVRKLLAENGENAGNFAEMAIGINPNARNTGVLIETEKQFGTAHIGIGNSANLGGAVWAPIHIDVIFDDPTITVDGRTILSAGEFAADLRKRESFTAFEPLQGPLTPLPRDTFRKEERLFTRWKDIQGVTRESQVGDDETARRAAETLTNLESGKEPTLIDRKVASIMRLYGLVR